MNTVLLRMPVISVELLRAVVLSIVTRGSFAVIYFTIFDTQRTFVVLFCTHVPRIICGSGLLLLKAVRIMMSS